MKMLLGLALPLSQKGRLTLTQTDVLKSDTRSQATL
jgi:hypothetical protein